MHIALTVRELEPADLADLHWSGGSEHIAFLATLLADMAAGRLGFWVVTLPNGRLVGLGGVDFRPDPTAGLIWMLAVHETLQSVGIGTGLIRALESRIAAAGRRRARIDVEHDNPRARALYARLGYAERGSTVDSWAVAGGRTFVTVCLVMDKVLPQLPSPPDAAP